MTIRVVRDLPASGLAILECLADSWYLKGLDARDLASMVGMGETEAYSWLLDLQSRGYAEIKNDARQRQCITWVATETGRRRAGRVR